MTRVQCLGGPELLLWCQSTQVRGQTCPLGFKRSAWIWGESLSLAFSVLVRALLPRTKSSKVFCACTCASVVAATLAVAPSKKVQVASCDPSIDFSYAQELLCSDNAPCCPSLCWGSNSNSINLLFPPYFFKSESECCNIVLAGSHHIWNWHTYLMLCII